MLSSAAQATAPCYGKNGRAAVERELFFFSFTKPEAFCYLRRSAMRRMVASIRLAGHEAPAVIPTFRDLPRFCTTGSVVMRRTSRVFVSKASTYWMDLMHSADSMKYVGTCSLAISTRCVVLELL